MALIDQFADLFDQPPPADVADVADDRMNTGSAPVADGCGICGHDDDIRNRPQSSANEQARTSTGDPQDPQVPQRGYPQPKDKEQEQLLKALANESSDLSVDPEELLDALAPEDRMDFASGALTAATLRAFARALVERRQLDQGEIPTHYVHRAICKRCGPVWLFAPGRVDGCPWCHNRIHGRPVPHPQEKQ